MVISKSAGAGAAQAGAAAPMMSVATNKTAARHDTFISVKLPSTLPISGVSIGIHRTLHKMTTRAKTLPATDLIRSLGVAGRGPSGPPATRGRGFGRSGRPTRWAHRHPESRVDAPPVQVSVQVSAQVQPQSWALASSATLILGQSHSADRTITEIGINSFDDQGSHVLKLCRTPHCRRAPVTRRARLGGTDKRYAAARSTPPTPLRRLSPTG